MMKNTLEMENLIDCVALSTVVYSHNEPIEGRLIDYHFMKVGFTQYASSLTHEEFYDLVALATKGTNISVEKLENGPSYFTLGLWLGDRTLALRLMALGDYHGVWRVMTPQVMGFTDHRIPQAIGLGAIFINGFRKLDLAEW